MTNEINYRGYLITGNENIRFIAVAPYGGYSPESYATVEDAMQAIDADCKSRGLDDIKPSNIREIHRYIKNGMYTENYTVVYRDGNKRMYTIHGTMINKHLMAMLNAEYCFKKYSKSGKHIKDVYWIILEK